jgi:hypothetical protein
VRPKWSRSVSFGLVRRVQAIEAVDRDHRERQRDDLLFREVTADFGVHVVRHVAVRIERDRLGPRLRALDLPPRAFGEFA